MTARVVLASERWGEVDAPDIADAMARGWQSRNPAAQVTTCPQSNGGADLVGVIAAARPDATIGVVGVRGPDGSASLAPYLQVEDEGFRTAYLPMAAGSRPAGAPGDSYGTGQAIRELISAGADRIVIGLADSGTLDGGAGLLAALAAQPPQDAQQHLDVRVISAAQDMVRDHGVRLVASYDTAIPLLGLAGAAAAAQGNLGLDPYAAQDAEARMSAWSQHLQKVMPGRTDLLTGIAHRYDRMPGAGSGGGAGFALAALGAELRPAAEVVAEATGLRDAIRGADLVVTGTLIFDWQQLTASVVMQVGSQAQSLARPALVLAGRVDVGRRELMSLGFSGGYGVMQSPRTPLPSGAEQILVAAQQLAHRVAGTWTPTHSPSIE